jgi:hypothetical protein
MVCDLVRINRGVVRDNLVRLNNAVPVHIFGVSYDQPIKDDWIIHRRHTEGELDPFRGIGRVTGCVVGRRGLDVVCSEIV